ncbi:hypothetical protein F8280_14210 [Micromonospora noduli]|nr:hypothetical protein F8280_14210 [Micromonospora noduli]
MRGGRLAVTSSNAGRKRKWSTAEHVPAEELARRQGIQPVVSVDDLAEQLRRSDGGRRRSRR